ncbi:hypothetical protein WAI453_011899 [Rhynchosporium graminicola]
MRYSRQEERDEPIRQPSRIDGAPERHGGEESLNSRCLPRRSILNEHRKKPRAHQNPNLQTHNLIHKISALEILMSLVLFLLFPLSSRHVIYVCSFIRPPIAGTREGRNDIVTNQRTSRSLARS